MLENREMLIGAKDVLGLLKLQRKIKAVHQICDLCINVIFALLQSSKFEQF